MCKIKVIIDLIRDGAVQLLLKFIGLLSSFLLVT
jgi:hypothetical protein